MKIEWSPIHNFLKRFTWYSQLHYYGLALITGDVTYIMYQSQVIYQNISVWAPQNPTPFYQVSTIIDLEQFEIKDQGYVQTIQDSFLWRHEKLLICYSMNTYLICDSPL